MTDREEWRPVVGYEGLYEVSNLGQVRSLDRLDAIGRPRRGAPLKPDASHPKGYLRVSLCRDKVVTRFQVHHLVLAAFVGPRPEGMEGCHSPDPNPANNRLENLRWDSSSENARDVLRMGRNVHRNKTHCSRGHLLEHPNLVQAELDRGWRDCRSCARARRNGPRIGTPVDRLADQYYQAIMTTQTTKAAA